MAAVSAAAAAADTLLGDAKYPCVDVGDEYGIGAIDAPVSDGAREAVCPLALPPIPTGSES